MTQLKWLKWIAVFYFLMMPVIAKPVVPAWQMVADESSITFTGIQNNAPVSGSFKRFNADIAFDENELSNSRVNIVVDMSSVFTSFSDFISTLLTAEWFNVMQFPHAVFKSSQFVRVKDNVYSAKGTLTIRDKTIPIAFNFYVTTLSENKKKVTGKVQLKRTNFDVGQGEWGDTDLVKNDVEVAFTITAVKK